MSDFQVVEVFEQFAIKNAEGKLVLFPSYEEAHTAGIAEANEAEFNALAEGYCVSVGLDGKNASAKIKVIKAFLAYQASLEVPEED